MGIKIAIFCFYNSFILFTDSWCSGSFLWKKLIKGPASITMAFIDYFDSFYSTIPAKLINLVKSLNLGSISLVSISCSDNSKLTD